MPTIPLNLVTDNDRHWLAHALGLKPAQRIVLAQSVGYPQPAA